MKKSSQLLLLTSLGLMLCLSTLRAQDANWSIDITGGSPYLMSNMKSIPSPYGGAGLRYSLNKFLSGQVMVNGGVFTGTDNASNTRFTNNFLQYSVRGVVNLCAFAKKPSRFNVYLYVGGGHLKTYSRQNFIDGAPDKNLSTYNSFFYVGSYGANIRFYMNENIDLLAGSDFNMTQSRVLDNNPGNGSYDHFMMNYVGISFKMLSATHKKQNPDWARVKLPYNAYDEAVKLAQEKAAKAEEELAITTKEAKRTQEEADAKLAKAEAFSLSVVEGINTVSLKLDTLKGIISFISQNGIIDYNKINNMHNMQSPSTTPSNDKSVPPVNNMVASFASYTKNVTPVTTVPSVVHATSNNYDVHVKAKNNNGPNNTEDMVKPFDMSQRYAIVMGSFVKPENAVMAKKQLMEKGYRVDIVHFNDPDVQRLVMYSGNIEEAQSRLTEIREKEQADAWLLSIER